MLELGIALVNTATSCYTVTEKYIVTTGSMPPAYLGESPEPRAKMQGRDYFF